MVATAGPRGALHPAQAWALLGTIFVGLLAIATQAHRMNVAPSDVPKPPAVLAERARNILAAVSADDGPSDSASWFDFEETRLGDARTSVRFVYRESPRYLVTQNVFHFVTDADPAPDVPGMATVTVDPLGRLIRFTRIVEEDLRSSAEAPITWTALFRDAGLDEREFASAAPAHSPRVPHDMRFGWTRISAGAGLPRVTAATLNGSVVQFDTAHHDTPANSRQDFMSTSRSPAGEAVVWLIIVSLFAGAGVLARHNLRRGEGDRRGARRLGVFVVCVNILTATLRAHHVPVAATEISWLFSVTGLSLVWGGFAWLVYVSLEPSLRRVWPRTLISWTRLLSGRVRDPLVGRDVLLGILLGILVMSIPIVRFWISGRSAPADTVSRALESLSSIRSFLNVAFAYQTAAALTYALGGAFLLLLIRLIVRKTWLAVAIALVAGLPFVPGGGVTAGWELILVLTPPLVVAALFLRVGLLAQFSLLLTDVLIRVPLTLDPDAWYFGTSLVVLLGLATLATCAFLISLGGRPAFGGSPA
jgi:serine/threonine-protein kinase